MGEYDRWAMATAWYYISMIFLAGLLIGAGLWVLYRLTAPWDSCLKIFGVGGCI